MSVITGIDLGTCFSAVAQFSESGEPLIVHNDDGKNITPSVVWINVEDRTIHVGEEARLEWVRGNPSTAARFKRDMGLDTVFDLGGDSFSARDLSAVVLKKLVKDTTTQLGTMGSAVVTIPANFGHTARVDTLSAAEHAGLVLGNDASLPNEPTAAALYYVFKNRGEVRGRYAVYDLGGGTFDVTILRVDGYRIEVLGTNGIRHLGGDDFDKAIQRIALQKMNVASTRTFTDRNFTLDDAEKLKIALSKRASMERVVEGVNLGVSRDEFETAISPLIQQAEMLCESVLESVGLTASQLDGVLLAGGSTRVPCVRQSVERVFGRVPDVTMNPDECVALGAAVYSALKADRERMSALQKRAIKDVSLAEICGHNFGTIALSERTDGRDPVEENCILIAKDRIVPCSVSREYYTVEHGQTSVLCRLTECDNAEERDPRFVSILGSAHLTLPPNRPAGQKVEVTYSIDENLKLHCQYRDIASGEVESIDLAVSPSVRRHSEPHASIDKFLIE